MNHPVFKYRVVAIAPEWWKQAEALGDDRNCSSRRLMDENRKYQVGADREDYAAHIGGLGEVLAHELLKAADIVHVAHFKTTRNRPDKRGDIEVLGLSLDCKASRPDAPDVLCNDDKVKNGAARGITHYWFFKVLDRDRAEVFPLRTHAEVAAWPLKWCTYSYAHYREVEEMREDALVSRKFVEGMARVFGHDGYRFASPEETMLCWSCKGSRVCNCATCVPAKLVNGQFDTRPGRCCACLGAGICCFLEGPEVRVA